MTGKRAETLLELMHQVEHFTLARAWEGLTDDEFFWEPFTTTWSIRRQDQCRTLNPFGAGEWVADFEIPEPTPVPMTTIAWLYWHIGSMPDRLCDIDLLGGTRTMASGWTSPYLTHHPIFTSSAAAVTALRDGWHRLREAIERADDDQLEVTTAGYTYAAGVLPLAAGPPGPAHTATHFIVGTLNEVGQYPDRRSARCLRVGTIGRHLIRPVVQGGLVTQQQKATVPSAGFRGLRPCRPGGGTWT